MTNQKLTLMSLLSITLLLALPAHGDTAHASCEVWHNGDHKKDASGSCKFSQRQGYIDIQLRNGTTWSLSPAKKADYFRDKEGREVKRHSESGKQVYKWRDRAIKVDFSGGDSSAHHGGAHHDERTPRDLHDLVGQTGGHAEDQLRARGYKLANSSNSGKDVYSNWKHKHGGQCVSVHSVNGHYKSITYAPSFDCQ